MQTCGAVCGRGGWDPSNLAFMYSRSAAAVLPDPYSVLLSKKRWVADFHLRAQHPCSEIAYAGRWHSAAQSREQR